MPSPKPQRHRRYKKWRAWVMRMRPLCEGHCASEGLFVPAQELHHIWPLSLGGALMDESNVRPLCRQCHHDHHNGRSVEAPAP